MRFNFLLFLLCSLLITSCGDNDKVLRSLSITTNKKNNIFTLGDTLKADIKNPKNVAYNSIQFYINDTAVNNIILLDTISLGVQKLKAVFELDERTLEKTIPITILNNQKPKVYGFEIINEYPHDINSYTQGLEFYDGKLYESEGQYGASKLRRIDYKTGEIEYNYDLDKKYFAEGLTIFNNELIQLTWKAQVGFVYNIETMERTKTFTYNRSKEGWGLCHDNELIYKSDGTENIWRINPENYQELNKIQVYTNKGKIGSLNELEWINGKIFANIYLKNGVAIINPKNGAVEGVIDFSSLRTRVKQHKNLDVLNGIAYNPETETLFVTGKLWDKLFEIKLIEK